MVRSRALLGEGRFFALWLSQGLSQTAQNALLFSLLVIVLGITNSSIHTSFLILSFILPSIPLGFAVGVLLDRVNKGPILVLTNVIRAALCVVLFFFHTNEWVIYGLSSGIATASLFFNPAVVALIPALVRRDRLVQANSLYNFTLTGAQLIGIVFLAPTVLKLFGADGVFIMTTAMFGIAAIAGARVSLEKIKVDSRPQHSAFGSIPTEFRESWHALTGDRRSVLALAQLIVSSTLVLLFAILIPRYMRDVIEVPADSAALVFAPTGIGALIGLRFIPMFARRGKNKVVVIGLAGIAVCLVLLALVNPIADVWKSAPSDLDPSRFLRVSLLQALVMCFAGPMGFFYALLNAPAQTVLHERAPPEMRGRIFATQVVSANFLSLVPLLAIGAITDILNVTVVLLILAAVVGGMAVISRYMDQEDVPDSAEERVAEGVGTN
ncbi:MAG: MFS transporter [Chloroflexota bacterium]